MKTHEIAAQARTADPCIRSAASRDPAHDLRTALRYPLQTDVAFHWVGADGISRDGRGQTRDVSQKGAYVESSPVQMAVVPGGQTAQPSGPPDMFQNTPATSPPHGATVKLSISLPAAVNNAKSVRMEVQGHVVRVEKGRDPRGSLRFGFAVSNDLVSLCTS